MRNIVDELHPLCIVGKDSNGLWHVVKTAKIHEAVSSDAVYKVAKGHLFKVDDFVTLGSDLQKASDKITSIDASNEDYDSLTLAATIGTASKGDVLVLAKGKAAAKSAKFFVEPAAITIHLHRIYFFPKNAPKMVRVMVLPN